MNPFKIDWRKWIAEQGDRTDSVGNLAGEMIAEKWLDREFDHHSTVMIKAMDDAAGEYDTMLRQINERHEETLSYVLTDINGLLERYDDAHYVRDLTPIIRKTIKDMEESQQIDHKVQSALLNLLGNVAYATELMRGEETP